MGDWGMGIVDCVELIPPPHSMAPARTPKAGGGKPAPSLPPARHEVVPLGKGPFGEADSWKEKGRVERDCGMGNADFGLR